MALFSSSSPDQLDWDAYRGFLHASDLFYQEYGFDYQSELWHLGPAAMAAAYGEDCASDAQLLDAWDCWLFVGSCSFEEYMEDPHYWVFHPDAPFSEEESLELAYDQPQQPHSQGRRRPQAFRSARQSRSALYRQLGL